MKDLPQGFALDELPEGFVVDDLPDGFVLDGQPQIQSQQSDGQRFINNIIPSTVQLVKDIATPFAHPLNTVDAIGNTLFGYIDKATGQESPEAKERMKYADMMNQYVKDRYGHPYETLINDPAGMATDVLGLITGGSGLVAKVAPKASKIANAANTVRKISSAADPVRAMTRTTKGAAKLIGKGAKELFGKTTGVGGGAVERAASHSDDFAQGLRSADVTQQTVVESARNMLRQLTENKRQQYLDDMSGVKAWEQAIDITPIQRKFKKLADKYGITAKPGKDGNLVLARSAKSKLNDQALADIQKVYDEINTWATDPRNKFSPADLDTLKIRVDDIYSETSKSRGFVSDLRNTIKDEIVKTVPEYKDAMRNYQTYSDLEREMSKTLSLTDKASVDTAFKKLTSTFRSNFEGRADVLARLKDSGVNPDSVLDMVAGLQMRDISAKGIMGQMTIGGSLVGLGAGNFQFIALLASTSPRIVAEFLGGIGWPKRSIGKLLGDKKFKAIRGKIQSMPKVTKIIGTPEGRAITSGVGRYQELIEQETTQ